MLLIATPLSAQNTTIKGIVLDKNSREPMIGVSVFVQGGSNGTITNLNGEFELTLSKAKDNILKFSYIGYKTLELPLKDNSYIRVQLEEDNRLIDEVVVVGYATQKKESDFSSPGAG